MLKKVVSPLVLALLPFLAFGDDGEGYAAYGEENQEYQRADNGEYRGGFAAPDWTGVGMLPLRCVNDNGVDSIIWSTYEDDNRQCKYNYLMHLSTPVPEFVKIYKETMRERNKWAAEQAYEDYYEEELQEEYLECRGADGDDSAYYLQLGCSKTSTKQLEIVAYAGDACSPNYRYEVDSNGNQFYDNDEGSITSAQKQNGGFRTGIDASAYQIEFETCVRCMNLDELADQDDIDWDEQNEKAFCEELWYESSYCDSDCQKLGTRRGDHVWNFGDIVLLVIEMLAFSAMFLTIVKKRNSMGPRERLIENTRLEVTGIKKEMVIGAMGSMLIITIAFAATKMVAATLATFFIVNVFMLIYMLKLTLFAKE